MKSAGIAPALKGDGTALSKGGKPHCLIPVEAANVKHAMADTRHPAHLVAMKQATAHKLAALGV